MKTKDFSLTFRLAAKLASCALVILLTDGAGAKEKTVSQRGWIGGEYVLAKPSTFLVAMACSPGTTGSLPKTLQHTQNAAILITKLETNTPAYLAGFRQGDFVLELNHRPTTSLGGFRRSVDRSEPGTELSAKVWRKGQTLEMNLPVGREKFWTGGTVSLAFPTVVHRWDLWPNPGFSLVLLGYEPNPGVRRDLGNNRETFDDEWTVFLGFVELTVGKRIVSEAQ